MKAKLKSCVALILVLSIILPGVINAANEVTYEEPAEKSVAAATSPAVKIGAKAFMDSIFDGSFIKKMFVANTMLEPTEIEEIVIEEPLEEAIEIDPSGEECIIIEPEEVLEDPSKKYVEINGTKIEYVDYIDVTATAYCLCPKCCGKSPSSPGYGVTASGLRIIPGTNMKVLSVDPKVIPLGTNTYVQGLNGASDYGFAVAADTGGAIKGNRIDLYYDTHQGALQWGRRTVRVYILPS